MLKYVEDFEHEVDSVCMLSNIELVGLAGSQDTLILQPPLWGKSFHEGRCVGNKIGSEF